MYRRPRRPYSPSYCGSSSESDGDSWSVGSWGSLDDKEDKSTSDDQVRAENENEKEEARKELREEMRKELRDEGEERDEEPAAAAAAAALSWSSMPPSSSSMPPSPPSSSSMPPLSSSAPARCVWSSIPASYSLDSRPLPYELGYEPWESPDYDWDDNMLPCPHYRKLGPELGEVWLSIRARRRRRIIHVEKPRPPHFLMDRLKRLKLKKAQELGHEPCETPEDEDW